MNEDSPNLVLTGFMGAGKTTTGGFIARRLGLPFIDTDSIIIARAGMKIPEIFARLGEAEFRRIEGDVCAELAAGRGKVIATGGGMLVNPDNLAVMMRGGVVICLWAALNDLRHRLKADPSRPLASNWETLFEQRQAVYAAMPHHIKTTGKSLEEVAEEAIALWRTHLV